jgi:DNA repair exonuclease SbcCD ATPase subunit
VRLDSLEVRDFRGIHSATIPFGCGVTVLHGPNELGKSTLVEAIHAALFVPVTSQVGNGYLTWGGSAPACVTLTFEHEGKRWRVSKRFGRRPEAKLESSELDSQHFREVMSGRGVDGKLRELLAWGIAPPGGRGAAPRAESFLLTALLGRQGEVQRILDTSLGRARQ